MLHFVKTVRENENIVYVLNRSAIVQTLSSYRNYSNCICASKCICIFVSGLSDCAVEQIPLNVDPVL